MQGPLGAPLQRPFRRSLLAVATMVILASSASAVPKATVNIETNMVSGHGDASTMDPFHKHGCFDSGFTL